MTTANEVQVRPEEKQLQTEGPKIVQEAQAFQVTDDLTCQQAVDKGNDVKKKLDWAIDFFAPMKNAAKAAHKAICDRENLIVKPYETAKALYIGKAAEYNLEKKKEADRKEALAKAEAEKKEKAEKKRLEDEAKAAEKKGDTKKAEVLREQKETVYVATKPVARPVAPEGMSVQTVWAPEVVDDAKVPAVWRGPVDLGRLKRAKTANPELQVPGIKFVQKAQGAALGR